MADRDAVLLPPARAFFEQRSPLEQHRLRRIFEDSCDAPEPDYVLRFLLDSPPDFPFLYRDDEFVIVYDELNAWTIAIWHIAHSSDELALNVQRP